MTTNGFAFFDGTSSNHAAPAITVRKGGILVLNQGAVKKLGDDVTHVQIGFDAEKRAIGVRPAAEDARGKYRLRAQKRSASRIVDGKRLFALHGLAADKARSFEIEDFGAGIIGVTLPAEMIAISKSDTKPSPKGKVKAKS